MPLERRSDFSGIKEIMKTLLRHVKIFPPTPIWNIFSYHILPPLFRASIYNPERPALSTNSASLEISSLSLQIRLSNWGICSQRQVSLQFHHLLGCYHPKKLKKLSAAKRPNCERNNAPIFTIRVPGAILILLRLFARIFIFGAEANISARAEVRHVIATKFQPSWPGWNSPCNQALR